LSFIKSLYAFCAESTDFGSSGLAQPETSGRCSGGSPGDGGGGTGGCGSSGIGDGGACGAPPGPVPSIWMPVVLVLGPLGPADGAGGPLCGTAGGLAGSGGGGGVNSCDGGGGGWGADTTSHPSMRATVVVTRSVPASKSTADQGSAGTPLRSPVLAASAIEPGILPPPATRAPLRDQANPCKGLATLVQKLGLACANSSSLRMPASRNLAMRSTRMQDHRYRSEAAEATAASLPQPTGRRRARWSGW
jgi:hypothetical protein